MNGIGGAAENPLAENEALPWGLWQRSASIFLAFENEALRSEEISLARLKRFGRGRFGGFQERSAPLTGAPATKRFRLKAVWGGGRNPLTEEEALPRAGLGNPLAENEALPLEDKQPAGKGSFGRKRFALEGLGD